MTAKVPPGDRADSRGEAVEPVEEVDHVHDGDDPDDGQRLAHPRRQLVDAEEREREVVDPDAGGDRDRGGADLPAELLPPARPRKSSIAPTAVATVAPSRSPRTVREVEERERGDDDPEEEREAAEPRDGIRWTRRSSGLVDGAEAPRHRCRPPGVSSNDDDEREPGAVEHLEVVARARARALLRPVQPVAGVAEARDDEAALVEPAVEARRRRCARPGTRRAPARPLRRGDEADQRHRARARLLDRSIAATLELPVASIGSSTITSRSPRSSGSFT